LLGGIELLGFLKFQLSVIDEKKLIKEGVPLAV
jgi:hypothetical protein